jgi:hypothetical protein
MKESTLNTSLKEEFFLLQKKMNRKERLNAFFTHSQLLIRLFEAGARYRKRNISRKILINSARKKIK